MIRSGIDDQRNSKTYYGIDETLTIDQRNSKTYYNIDETLMGDQRSSSERVITTLTIMV